MVATGTAPEIIGNFLWTKLSSNWTHREKPALTRLTVHMGLQTKRENALVEPVPVAFTSGALVGFPEEGFLRW